MINIIYNLAIKLIKQIDFIIVRYEVKLSKFRYGLNKEERKQKIIVSMTSYPRRFNTIILPLKSLLMQSHKPDRIILWLGSDSTEDMLTEDMKKLREYGVEYRFDSKYNLKPHKKYFYALQEFSQDLVITVDDDAIYPRNLIESLIKEHNKYPEAVCARRVHYVTQNNDGKIEPYANWIKECKTVKNPSDELIAVGVGGVLYPPNSLDKRAFDIDAIFELCPKADDIWLWYMEQLKGTKTVWVPCILVHPPVIKETWEFESLADSNIENNMNDQYLKQLIERYGSF